MKRDLIHIRIAILAVLALLVGQEAVAFDCTKAYVPVRTLGYDSLGTGRCTLPSQNCADAADVDEPGEYGYIYIGTSNSEKSKAMDLFDELETALTASLGKSCQRNGGELVFSGPRYRDVRSGYDPNLQKWNYSTGWAGRKVCCVSKARAEIVNPDWDLVSLVRSYVNR